MKDRARLSVKFYIERLRSQIADLLDQEYPGHHPGPKKWLHLINGVIDTADSYLLASRNNVTNQNLETALVRDAAQLASQAYRCLQLFEGAKIQDLPYAIVSPLQRWFDQLGIANTTFFRSELVANYELASFEEGFFARIRDKSQRLSDAISEIEWPLIRVTVPSKALGIIPHFAIVAHEIGHAIYPRVPWDLSGVAHNVAVLRKNIASKLDVQSLDCKRHKNFVASVFSMVRGNRV